MLGEINAIAHIGAFDLLDAPKKRPVPIPAVSLAELPQTLKNLGLTDYRDGADYLENCYLSYELEPNEDPDADWRADVFAGSTRLPALINDYMKAESGAVDAFHADGLFLVNACADLYNPKTVRASMGAVFRCPVWACTLSVLRGLLTKSGLPLYGAALRADTVDVRRADFARCAVAIGSEGKGLSAEVLEACDLTVKIPMSDHCESLNAAAAAAVLLWEAARDD